jgi:AcrR family transcriptional regulator
MANVNRSRTSSSGPRERAVGAITNAVERLLDDGHEYAALTVAQICDEADFPRSTFYFHFRDKGDLLVAMTEGAKTFLLDTARTWWEADAEMPREELEEVVGLLVGAYRAHEGLLNAVMDARPYDQAVNDAFAAMVEEIRSGLEGHITRGQVSGRFDRTLDAACAAGWIVSMFERSLHQLVVGLSDEEADEYADTLSTFVWRAVYSNQTLSASA